MRIEEWLNPRLVELRRYENNGKTYYLACEVLELLKLSNITNAMGRSLPTPKIHRRNWEIQLIPEVNRERGVYLFTYEGIIEIISNNKNAECKRLKQLYCQ